MSTIDNTNQLRSWKPPYRPEPLIEDDLLSPGSTMMIFGAAGTYKTFNAIHLAVCLALGVPWFDLETRQCTVLYHQAELSKAQAKVREIGYLDTNKLSSPNLFWYSTEGDSQYLDTSMDISRLSKQIDEVRNRAADPSLPLVVILDPLKHYMKGHISDEYEVAKFQRNIDPLRLGQHVTFILIHHARLSKTDNDGKVIDLGAQEIMGSSYWNNWLDTILGLHVTNPFSGGNHIKMNFGKHRNAEQFHPSWTIEWNRPSKENKGKVYLPTIIERELPEESDPSVRNLV